MLKTVTKKLTIGSIAMAAIQAGKTDEQVIGLVKKVHPDCRTSKASVSWYRGFIKSNGKTAARATKKRAHIKAVK